MASYFAGGVMVTGALKSAQTSSASAAESVRRRANRDLPAAAVASADRDRGILRYLHVAPVSRIHVLVRRGRQESIRVRRS